jgi:hypothetical protein
MKKERMKHFTLEEWADFVREVISHEQRATMQRHLDHGCKKCLKAVGLWRNVSDFARSEMAYIPPETAVRSAKAYYAFNRPQEGLSGVARIAKLIFDSFRQPLAAGVRTASVSARQLLYKVQDIQVDIRLEPEARRSSMVGQVLDSSRPDPAVKGAAVILLRGGQDVARTATNDFGEFQLEFDSEELLQLSIKVGEQGTVLIPLRGLEPKRGD